MSPGLGFLLFKSIDGLYVTGNIVHGQLCINTTNGANVMNPNKITDVDTNIECITFEVMKTSLFVLFKDGSAGACSRNNSGQLGGH